jgi:hypothetical protein
MLLSDVFALAAREREARRPGIAHSPPLQRPLPQVKVDTGDHGTRYSLAARVQCLTLLSIGHTPKEIESWIKIPERQARRLWDKAKERGYDPTVDPRILNYHVEDGKPTGRPKKIKEDIEQRVLELVRADRAGRKKTSHVLAYECGISSSSVLRILDANNLR